ncbi:MAG TPA: hypothetical protein VIJ82_08075 [Streptosporangiaceae bacterium]
MQRSRTSPVPPAHAWLLDLLFTGASAVTWAAAGQLPAGYDRAEQLAVLSSGARSFLVSLGALRGAASALTSYNALRPARKRLARRALGLGLRAGLAQPLLRDKIDIGVASGATAADLSAGLLGEHLREVFGAGPVVVAIGGGGGPYRKPVLQVFTTRGTPLGYIKVGWNDWTRDAVGREADALRACADHPMRIGVPRLLGRSQWRGLDLLITAPLPRRVRGLGPGARAPDAQSLREISRLSPPFAGELAASPWWRGVRARIQSAVTDPEAAAVLSRAAERLEDAFGRVRLEFGTWHGDLVPWNLARIGPRLYAWDWESSAPDAPLGFDVLHFHFQVAFVAWRYPLEQAVPYAVRTAAPTLAELGLPASACGLMATLHLVELFLRHEEARSSAGDIDERFYPVVEQVLDRALAPDRGLAGLAGRVA